MKNDSGIRCLQNIIQKACMVIMSVSKKDKLDVVRIDIFFLDIALKPSKPILVACVNQNLSIFVINKVIVYDTISKVDDHLYSASKFMGCLSQQIQPKCFSGIC